MGRVRPGRTLREECRPGSGGQPWAIASSTTFRKQLWGLEGVGPRTGLTDGSLWERFRLGAADEAEAAFAALVDRHAPRVPRILAQATDLVSASSRFLREALPDGRRTGGVLGEEDDRRSGQVRLPNRARAQITEIGGRTASIVRRAAGREWRDPRSPAAGPGPVALHGPEYDFHERRGWPMEYALWVMLVGFSVVGATSILAGGEGLWITWRRRPFLRSAVGEVIRVEMHYLSTSDSDSGDDSVYTPVVRFKTASGEVKTFTSAVSVGSSSTYKVRMTIPLLYDPDNVIPPRIDSWMTIWGYHIVFLVLGGLVGLGGAAFLYWMIFPLVLHNRI
jgi:hypothetical protein